MDCVRNTRSHDFGFDNITTSTTKQVFPPLFESFANQVQDTRGNQFYEPRHHTSNRNASPSRASVQSAQSASSNVSTSSFGVAHLKRRDGKKHMRNLHFIGQPSFDPPINIPISVISSSETSSKRSSPLVSLHSQLSRSNTAPSPKRPPASHSSYGVETIVGPPPSFDTRRTHSTERVWRVDRSKPLRTTLGTERIENSQTTVIGSTSAEPLDIIAPKVSVLSSPLLADSSPDTADTESVSTPTDAEDVGLGNVMAHQEHGLGLSQSEAGSKSSGGSQKSEDLFLNIARVNTGRPSISISEKRKPRASLPFLSDTRPATSHSPESTRLHADDSLATPRARASAYHNKRASLPFSHLRDADQVSDNGSIDASNSGYFSKRSSTIYADTIRPIQRSATTLRSNRLVPEAGYTDKPKSSEHVATESTVSTTAPSTVWDELDDLKSRIRKLELTGKLPPSSAAAMSSAERPRTATTAATTMSSSPKHNKSSTQISTAVEGVSSVVHPLLQEALSNAKTVVSHDVYQKLQSTAQDALQLASLTTYDTAAARNSASATTDRQIRRRTESLCRSLTELAIALSTEQKSAQLTHRPTSMEHHLSSTLGGRSQIYSHNTEPGDKMPPSVRVQSRLESRRVSTQTAYANVRHSTPDIDSPTTLSSYPYSGSRNTRVASTFRTRRSQPMLDGANDEEDLSPEIRPVSRAMTDLATARQISRDHTALSREYTSQHPIPASTDPSVVTRAPLPANLSTNFISRRKYNSPTTQSFAPDSSPLTSRQSWGRISVIQPNPPQSDTGSEAPTSNRSVSTRRSLGFASRLGSSVGNRLRGAKMERSDSRGYKDLSPTTSREVSSEDVTAR